MSVRRLRKNDAFYAEMRAAKKGSACCEVSPKIPTFAWVYDTVEERRSFDSETVKFTVLCRMAKAVQNSILVLVYSDFGSSFHS